MGASDALVARFVSEGAGASGQDAVDLITRATGAPGLYYFSELLDLPGLEPPRRGPQLRADDVLQPVDRGDAEQRAAAGPPGARERADDGPA